MSDVIQPSHPLFRLLLPLIHATGMKNRKYHSGSSQGRSCSFSPAPSFPSPAGVACAARGRLASGLWEHAWMDPCLPGTCTPVRKADSPSRPAHSLHGFGAREHQGLKTEIPSTDIMMRRKQWKQRPHKPGLRAVPSRLGTLLPCAVGLRPLRSVRHPEMQLQQSDTTQTKA